MICLEDFERIRRKRSKNQETKNKIQINIKQKIKKIKTEHFRLEGFFDFYFEFYLDLASWFLIFHRATTSS